MLRQNEVRQHVEAVLSDPTYVLPGNDPGHVVLIPRNGRDKLVGSYTFNDELDGLFDVSRCETEAVDRRDERHRRSPDAHVPVARLFEIEEKADAREDRGESAGEDDPDQAGEQGGDSQPEHEWEETLHKAAGILAAAAEPRAKATQIPLRAPGSDRQAAPETATAGRPQGQETAE